VCQTAVCSSRTSRVRLGCCQPSLIQRCQLLPEP
jgi:hypothetical protein